MVTSMTPYSSARVSRASILFWFKSKALLFASAFFFFEALRLPFRLFSRRWSSSCLDRTATFCAIVESQVVDACVTPTALSATARPCFLSRLSTTSTSPWLPPLYPWSSRFACCPPTDGTSHHSQNGCREWPACSAQNNRCSCVAFGRGPIPVIPGGRLTILPRDI